MRTPSWITSFSNPNVNKKNYIPIYSPVFTGNERKYLLKCLDDGWISPKGKFVTLLEEKFAKYCGAPFAIACESGTTAIFLALTALGIGKGDQVIVPSFTMVSSALAVAYTGATAVFVDCQLDTGNIDCDKITPLICANTKAILPVHIYGTPANLEQIHDIVSKHRLSVIEDAAEAIGSVYQGKKIGSHNITAFSFYVNKIITTGQGGMLTVNSKKIYLELKRLNNYYFSPVRHFWHEKIGYNFKLSNLQAAVGLAQLENIEKILAKKKKIASWYKELLAPFAKYFIPFSTPTNNSKSNYWMIAYRVSSPKLNIVKLRRILAGNGIETRSFFIPLHLQPVFRKKEYIGKFPNSEMLAKTGVLLPSGPSLEKSDVERICSYIHHYFKH